ncbi:PEP/pyruvate-binding domain-containing protein [Granulicoccus phenolivorans]|uniref:PEP/pyruvate-binding domain-containing protein n=1 Tax=Granulicoccus phenolivorans TaxID=266854 RepID=UPI0004258808|nr:PEP/pyruvate-binding domain-containing protein [Granulicoccus phenolivorans]
MPSTCDLTVLRRDDLALAGGKGANLGELLAADLPVPDGFVLTTDAYRAFVADNDLQPRIEGLLAGGDLAAGSAAIAELFAAGALPPPIAAALREAYARLGTDVAVAVRSSATAEDLAEAFFAGQQETILNVRGGAALEAAVRRCWASLWSARAIDYRAARGVDSGQLALAVVVQRLVAATASGVMFTANPTTGRTDEIIVSAAWGLGEAVVSGAVTTDDVVVRGGRVTSRTTAAKQTRTVLTEQGVRNLPTTDEQRTAAVLTDADALELAALGSRAAAHFGVPQDLEWARDADGRFWLVQSRPITALPEPVGPVPTQWPVPAGADVYIRGSLIEQLPDPLSPLFADLSTELVVPGLLRTLERFLGRKLPWFGPADLSFVTINGYAYYGYRNSLMLKVGLYLPAALRLVFSTLGRDRWRADFRPRYAEVVRRRQAQEPHSLTATELLDGIVEVVGEAFAYYTSVQAIIPEAVTSESLFTTFYDRLVRRPADPRSEDFLLGFDSAPLRADQSVFELAQWVRRRPALARALEAGEGMSDRVPADVPAELWQEFRGRFHDHLARFGHATYNLDLVNPVAADDPAPVLDALRYYLRPEAVSPAERRQGLADRRVAAREAVLGRLRGPRRELFVRLLDFANALGPVREDALADVGLGWPVARAYAQELGRRLTDAGTLSGPDDVYWLHREELAEAARRLDRADPPEPMTDLVAGRQADWRGRRRATPPAILPLNSIWHAFDSVMPNVMTDQSGPVLTGTGASGGRVTGIARVVRGQEDFGGMQPGEILVAQITTPAWTPLFGLAAAVVTDIGGPLSHSSIVAREYRIPAVLGTTVATTRIATGDRITVDGEAGTVTLLDEAATPTPAAPTPAAPQRTGAAGRGRWIAAAVLAAGAAGLVWRLVRRSR